MYSFRLVSFMLLAAMTAGCAGEPFVDRNYMGTGSQKEKLPGYDGPFYVCYNSDTPQSLRDEMAREACASFGLQPLIIYEQRWQCRLTVPHRATYRCVNPDMRWAGGAYVDVTSKSEVERWREAQAAGGRDKNGLVVDPRDVFGPADNGTGDRYEMLR